MLRSVVKIRGSKLTVKGRRIFLLGVNYWCRKHNILMWRRWDPGAIAEDLDRLKQVGVKALRVFLLAEDFSTPEGRVREEAVSRLEMFLDEAAKRDLIVFPSLIVGHMSGKNWPIPWDPKNEIYSIESIAKARSFVEQVVRRLRGHPAIGGWILSNEVTNVREPRGLEEFRIWVRELVSAIKENDPGSAVGVGSSTAPFGRLSRRPENVVDLVDYFSPHIYYYDDDPVRHTYAYPFALEYCLSLGKATVLEEYGFPTNLYSEESHGKFVSLVAYAALAIGASGAWVWCAFDFERETDEPYLWEPHELSFGIFRRDGTPKPAVRELKDFSEFLGWFEGQGFERASPNCAVLVPSYFYREYPFYSENRQDMAAGMLTAYILVKAAGLRPTFIREEDSIDFRLVIVPPYARLLTSTWGRLLESVEKGGTVYYSHVRYAAHLHVSACHIWEELFGVKPSLRPGAKGVFPEPPLRLRFVRDLPPVRSGEEYEYPLSRPDAGSTGFVPVDAVVCATLNGVDAVFTAKRGGGHAVLSAFPLELYLAYEKVVDWSRGYHKLYQALAELAGLELPIRVSDPRVQCEEWVKGSERIVFLLNHSWDEVRVELATGYELVEVVRGKLVGKKPPTVSLGGKSVGVLRMEA